MIELPKSGLLATVVSALFRSFLAQLDNASLPKYEGVVSLPGLRNKVEAFWDAHAVPHLFANNEHDLFFAQGYLHAQERLWQMDMSRRFLSGRCASLLILSQPRDARWLWLFYLPADFTAGKRFRLNVGCGSFHNAVTSLRTRAALKARPTRRAGTRYRET
jgi:hypothetical protein